MANTLPASLQKELDDAEALQKSLYPETEDTEETPQPIEPEADDEPVVQQDVEVIDATPQEKAPEVSEDTWKSRFATINGKYQAEVPKLHDELRATKTQLDEALKGITFLRDQLTTITASKAPVDLSDVSEEDKEAFGEDLINMMKKIAAVEAGKSAKTSEAHVKSVSAKLEDLEKTAQDTAFDKFLVKLGKEVSDFEEINADPKWLDWLGEYSPEVGGPRQDALNNAVAAHDVARTASLFKAFKALTPEAPQVDTKKEKLEKELKQQVSPHKTSSNAAPKADKTWTGDDYAAAFDVRHNNSKTVKEVEALQAAAEKALQEGRVRW